MQHQGSRTSAAVRVQVFWSCNKRQCGVSAGSHPEHHSFRASRGSCFDAAGRLLTRPVASSGRPRTCASSPLRWRHDGHNPDRVSNRPDDAAARFRSRGSSSRLHGARLLAGSHFGCREQALSRARDPRSGEDRSPGAAPPTSALQGRPEARRAPCKVVKARLCHRRVAGVAGRALQGAVGDGRMPAPTRNEVSRVASFRIVSRFRKSAFGVVALSLLVLTSGATGVGLACATGARSSRVRLGE